MAYYLIKIQVFTDDDSDSIEEVCVYEGSSDGAKFAQCAYMSEYANEGYYNEEKYYYENYDASLVLKPLYIKSITQEVFEIAKNDLCVCQIKLGVLTEETIEQAFRGFESFFSHIPCTTELKVEIGKYAFITTPK